MWERQYNGSEYESCIISLPRVKHYRYFVFFPLSGFLIHSITSCACVHTWISILNFKNNTTSMSLQRFLKAVLFMPDPKFYFWESLMSANRIPDWVLGTDIYIILYILSAYQSRKDNKKSIFCQVARFLSGYDRLQKQEVKLQNTLN